MLDHATLGFVITGQSRKHRQSSGIARGPAGGAQSIAFEVEFCSVGSLPIRAYKEGLPGFPGKACPRLDNNRVAVPTRVINVLLRLLQRQSVGSRRPTFDGHVGRNWIGAWV